MAADTLLVMGPIPVMGCTGRDGDRGDQANLGVRFLSPAFPMSSSAPSVLLPWGDRKGKAFLAQRLLATAMRAAGRETCWTSMERCAWLLAPGCSGCRGDEHTGRLAPDGGDQTAGTSKVPMGSEAIPSPSHRQLWPLLAAGL